MFSFLANFYVLLRLFNRCEREKIIIRSKSDFFYSSFPDFYVK